MLRSVPLLFLVGVALGLAGCSRPVRDFAFETKGATVGLRAGRDIAAGRQGLFLPLESGEAAGKPARTTLLFSLDKPQPVGGKGEAFYLTYVPLRGPLELRLIEQTASRRTETTVSLPVPGVPAPGSGASPPANPASFSPKSSATAAGAARPPASAAARPAPAGAPEVRFLLPVARGEQIVAFRVTSSSPRAGIRIRRAGLTRDEQGVTFTPTLVSISDGVAVATAPAGDAVTTISFPKLVSNLGGAQAQIILTYSYAEGAGTVRLTAEGAAGRTQSYYVNLRPGTHRLYLYTASCGFTPDAVRIVSGYPEFSIDSLEVKRFPTPPTAADLSGATTPIPADLGAILAYGPTWWRQSDYELFSWSLIPSVLVMEFRTYALQQLYMKRIDYFVEMRGYAGKLWTNAQLADRLGWNANDFRPKDLARFYATAAREKFTLNPEEEHLKAILLANGVILQKGSTYIPGKGALLTFAHRGSYWLRLLLLTHESFHGIFFTHPAYRKAVFAIWDHTNPEERKLFRNVFLAYEGYDINDSYLVENEFQAYLMEQTMGATQPYFDSALTLRMKKMKIPDTSALYRYFAKHPKMFRNSAEQVQRAVEAAAGVMAGETIELVPR